MATPNHYRDDDRDAFYEQQDWRAAGDPTEADLAEWNQRELLPEEQRRELQEGLFAMQEAEAERVTQQRELRRRVAAHLVAAEHQLTLARALCERYYNQRFHHLLGFDGEYALGKAGDETRRAAAWLTYLTEKEGK